MDEYEQEYSFIINSEQSLLRTQRVDVHSNLH